MPLNSEHDPQSENADSRVRDRDSMFVKARMRLSERGEEVEARVRNISAGGLMAEAPVEATRGERVEVDLRNIGWVFGSVAWSTGRKFGVAFNAPINPKLVRNPIGGNNEAISLVHRPDRQSLKRKY